MKNTEIKNEYKNQLVLSFLTINKEEWFIGKDIETTLGITNIRVVINDLRISNNAIISDTKKGYKLTDDKEEIKKCYKRLIQRNLKSLQAVLALKNKF